MGYQLRAGISAGRIDSDDLGSFEIRGGKFEVDDYETAAALVDEYNVVEWPSDEPGPPAHANAPEDAGPPDDRGPPDDAGPPEDAGRPEDAGPPEDAGRPDEPGEGEGEEEEEDEDDDESEVESKSRDELEDMAYAELQRMAMESDRDDINGRSSMDDIIDAFAESDSEGG